jgi:hypothetical protein
MSSGSGNVTIVSDIEARIQTLKEMLDDRCSSDGMPATVEGLQAFEQSLHSQTRELADLIAAKQVQKTMDADAFKEDIRQFAQLQPGRLKNLGYRPVNVRFIGGTVITLRVIYYARRCDEKRATGKKRKGLYPALCLLGIHDHCTPGLASQISLASAALCSLQEARHMLVSYGCVLDIKTVRNVVKRLAARARLALERDDSSLSWDTAAIEGRRVVVSTDGGRLRIRQKKRGPKTKKGYNRFTGEWKEPKLFIIYIVDDERRQDKKICPYLDGTLNGSDAVFGMLVYYLKQLKVSAADTLLFVADGAWWIWQRVKPLLQALNLKSGQALELIDFYHAVEHLNEFAKLKSTWSQDERAAWVKKYRRQLRKGHIATVIDALKLASKGTKNKLLRRERNYFIKNESRMNYEKVSSLKLPIGSGAMESSIRRVVNMRLKGPCIFWSKDSANEMLMLRSYYKAGRWDMLEKLAFQAAG